MKMSPRALALAAALIGLGVAVDQATKAWAVAQLRGTGALTVIPKALALVYVENRNAAFGLGGFLPDSAKRYVLLALTLALTVALALFLVRSPDFASRLGFGITISGALGNIVDRAFRGYVVDFIYWHGGFSWPNFNVADMLVCTGVGVLLVFGGGPKEKAAVAARGP